MATENRTNITITIPNGLAAHEASGLSLLLKDAVGEFVSRRGPTSAEYVAKRYDWMSAQDRHHKEQQVEDRKAIARKLLPALDRLEVAHVTITVEVDHFDVCHSDCPSDFGHSFNGDVVGVPLHGQNAADMAEEVCEALDHVADYEGPWPSKEVVQQAVRDELRPDARFWPLDDNATEVVPAEDQTIGDLFDAGLVQEEQPSAWFRVSVKAESFPVFPASWSRRGPRSRAQIMVAHMVRAIRGARP